jgi:hypothetical protein
MTTTDGVEYSGEDNSAGCEMVSVVGKGVRGYGRALYRVDSVVAVAVDREEVGDGMGVDNLGWQGKKLLRRSMRRKWTVDDMACEDMYLEESNGAVEVHEEGNEDLELLEG